MVVLLASLLLGAGVRAQEGMPHADHADNPLRHRVLVDELEWHAGEEDALHVEVDALIRRDDNGLLLRFDGGRERGSGHGYSAHALWWHPVTAWWELVAGLRHDEGDGPSRTFAVIGLQGTAPWRLHAEATAYAGEGRTGAKALVHQDVLLTNRWILQPRLEAEGWSDSDERHGIGRGLSSMKAGLRLRYEIRREIAPYVGVEWVGRFADTADLARAQGDPVRDTLVVAGLRLAF